MHIYRRVLLPALLAAAAQAFGQDVNEAYNLSNLTVQGSARSMGLGNTLGSIGGDFSSLSVNPAGIGVYRSSELTITPSLRLNSATAQYQGTSATDNKTNFNINNFGIIFTDAPKGKRYDQRSWKAVSFGFGMNRVADFNRNYTYEGRNNTSSATQAFEADANANPGNANDYPETYGYLGYQSYLLNVDKLGGYFYSVVPFSGGIDQRKTVRESGRINEYVFSIGGNYMEKILLGATIGLPTFVYNSHTTYSEKIATNNTAANQARFESFSYDQFLSLSGNGINVKLGAIYKATEFLRIGAAFHSPTAYSITDRYSPSLSTHVGGQTTALTVGNGALAQNEFSYTFISPWKGLVSAAFIIKNKGFISADFEYTDYSTMRFSYPDDDYLTSYSLQQQEDDMNRTLKKMYKAVSSFRIGGEAVLTKYFLARAGVGYYGNAYKIAGQNSQRTDFCGGLGFKLQPFFADIALVHSIYQDVSKPYAIDYRYVYSGQAAAIPSATTDFKNNNIALTIGVKF